MTRLLELPARTASATIAVSVATIAAASAAATRTASAEGATAAAGVPTLGARTRFVHSDRAPAHVASIERGDRGIRLRAIGHLYEAKSTQASAELIANQVHFADRSVFSKSLS